MPDWSGLLGVLGFVGFLTIPLWIDALFSWLNKRWPQGEKKRWAGFKDFEDYD